MIEAQTIFALATAPGKAGVSVFRLSGPQARMAITSLCAPNNLPAPRAASLRLLKNPITQESIDRVLVLLFPAPHSFTGEDVVEFHTHGGRAVANAVSECLAALPGFRLATPGEFTRRAFENGKMDLTEAEAIADLVHAETEAQRKQALRQLEGELGRLYEDWRQRLLRSLAYLEAAIDFADEELPADMIETQSMLLGALRDEIKAHLNDDHRGERIRDGLSIAILGPPNAGKSSLLNALAGRDAAIVSATAGTTRDIVEIHMDIGGYAVTLADTAGLRDAADEIESEGIRRAYALAAQSDLKLFVIDGTAPDIGAVKDVIDADTIIAVNKTDLALNKPDMFTGVKLSAPIFVSARTGVGIDRLLHKLAQEIERRIDKTGPPPLTRARHREALGQCVDHLDRALEASMADKRAEDARLAMRALGHMTGRVDVEDLLDVIFRDFCIGK